MGPCKHGNADKPAYYNIDNTQQQVSIIAMLHLELVAVITQQV